MSMAALAKPETGSISAKRAAALNSGRTMHSAISSARSARSEMPQMPADGASGLQDLRWDVIIRKSEPKSSDF